MEDVGAVVRKLAKFPANHLKHCLTFLAVNESNLSSTFSTEQLLQNSMERVLLPIVFGNKEIQQVMT